MHMYICIKCIILKCLLLFVWFVPMRIHLSWWLFVTRNSKLNARQIKSLSLRYKFWKIVHPKCKFTTIKMQQQMINKFMRIKNWWPLWKQKNNSLISFTIVRCVSSLITIWRSYFLFHFFFTFFLYLWVLLISHSL